MNDLASSIRAETAAVNVRLQQELEPVSVLIPHFDVRGEAKRVVMTYSEAAMLHYELGRVLAQHARRKIP